MTKRHKLLDRQIRRYFKGSLERCDGDFRKELDGFLDAVSAAYNDFDTDRALIERTQELSSNELLEEKLNAEKKTIELQIAIQQLNSTEARLLSSAKLSALGEMAGGIAHEINSPLAAIQMRVEQLDEAIRAGEVDTATFLRSTGTILNTVKRISKVIHALKTFAREGAGDAVENHAMSELIQNTLQLCQERFLSKGIRISVHAPKEIIVPCRPVEISQVLLNLLNNACDAIDHLPEKWIEISVSMHDAHIEVGVSDSGAGIPENIRAKLMQPFFTTKEIGKGLGLSSSRGIAESHGGSLSIDAQCPNTRFVLTLPKAITVAAAAVS